MMPHEFQGIGSRQRETPIARERGELYLTTQGAETGAYDRAPEGLKAVHVGANVPVHPGIWVVDGAPTTWPPPEGMTEVIVRDAALAQDPIRCIDARFCEIVRTEYELAEAPSTAFVALAMCIWGHTKKTVNISTSVIMPCEAEQTWLNKLAHAGIVVREAPPRPPEEEDGRAINAPI